MSADAPVTKWNWRALDSALDDVLKEDSGMR